MNTVDDHTGGGMSWMPRRRTRRALGIESNRSHGVLYDFPSQTDQNSNKRYEMEFLMQGWSVAGFRKNEELNMSLGGKGGAGSGSNFDGGISVHIW